MRLLLSALAGAAVLGSFSSEAHAAPSSSSSPSNLVAAMSNLSSEIALARARSPEAFRQTAAAIAKVDELDALKRGPLANLKPLFLSLGPDGVYALLDAYAFPGHYAEPKAPSGKRALRVTLLEVLGDMRDAKAASTFRAVLGTPSVDELEVRAAVEGLGALGDEASVALISELTRTTQGARKRAVIGGLRKCHRLEVVNALRDVLTARVDRDTAKAAAQALGRVASRRVTLPQNEPTIRREAAAAALKIFVAFDSDVRAFATDALVQIAAPETSQLIEVARAASGRELAGAFDELENRLRGGR